MLGTAIIVGLLVLAAAALKKAPQVQVQQTPAEPIPQPGADQRATGDPVKTLDVGATIETVTAIGGTVLGVATPIVTSIVAGTTGGATGATTSAGATGAGGVVASQLGGGAKAAMGSGTAVVPASASSLVSTATSTALATSQAAAAVGFAAILQVAIYVAVPMAFDIGRQFDFANRLRGRPKAELLRGWLYNIWRRENELLEKFLVQLRATGRPISWELTNGGAQSQVTYTNTRTGEQYTVTYYEHPRLVVNIAGLSVDELRELSTWARFLAFFEARTFNKWATLAASDMQPLLWSTNGVGLTPLEWAQEVEGVYFQTHGLYVSPFNAAALYASWPELESWANAQKVTDVVGGPDKLPRLLNLVRFAQVRSWFKQQGQMYAANSGAPFRAAAASFFYEYVTLQGEAVPFIIVRGVGPEENDPQRAVLGDGYAIRPDLDNGFVAMGLKEAELRKPWGVA